MVLTTPSDRHPAVLSADAIAALKNDIKCWGAELGLQRVGITDCDLSGAERRLLQWLDDGMHGEMEWMARHGSKRTRPVLHWPTVTAAITS